MNYQMVIDTAVSAGEIMLKNGAETYRVEETINYILSTVQVESTDAFVIPTGIMASIKGKDAEALTVVRRVPNRQNNLGKVAEVNELSRKLCAGEMTLEEAAKDLQEIDKKTLSKRMISICTILVAASFTILFGGTWREFVAGGINGALLAGIVAIGSYLGANSFFKDVVSAIVITAGAILCKVILPFEIDTEIVIISSMMPLVPGVAITNAVRDTLQKDYLAGAARAMEAFLIAAAIALGVAIGIALFGDLAGGFAI